MPRIIGEGVINEFILNDPHSGDRIVLYYRFPTAEERINYMSAEFERDGDKIKMKVGEARQNFGSKILLGIRKGDLLFKEDGKPIRPVCSDPEDPDFIPEWKALVEVKAADLIEALAQHAFGIPNFTVGQKIKGEENYNPGN